MNDTQKEFVARMKPFAEQGWLLKPSSYQIRNPDGSVGGWVAQVHVMRDTFESLTMQPLQQTDVKIYDSADEANSIALWMGLRWLEAKGGA